MGTHLQLRDICYGVFVVEFEHAFPKLKEFGTCWGLSLIKNRFIYLDSCHFRVVQKCIEIKI